MPVVTFDLVFGTSKLEKLNLSYNAIGDIRKGKLEGENEKKKQNRFVSERVYLFVCRDIDGRN